MRSPSVSLPRCAVCPSSAGRWATQMTRCAWDDIVGQTRVADFLRASVEGDRSVHAYLFVGPPGAGKATAARAFACALLCADNGCGACGACQRVTRGSHPDVHVVRPEGAASYLIEQVRDLIRDANLAPVEGPKKVYIVGDADLFNDSSANAFLKTLEEPPDDVVFILMAHAYDAVLPTIASRCQIVRFRRIPPSIAASLLRSQTGATEAEATAALAAAGGVIARARDFLDSSARRAARDEILRGLNGLTVMDDLDVLDVAKSLLVAVKAPLEDAKAAPGVEMESQSEFMGRGQIKALEERHKRELTAREREGRARGAQRRRELAEGLLSYLAGRSRSGRERRRFRRHGRGRCGLDSRCCRACALGGHRCTKAHFV